jgi:hypothetical protein
MSIFDDIPLEVGTAWNYEGQSLTIIGWDAATQRYHVRRDNGPKVPHENFWRSREKIESWHGNSLMSGLEVTQINAASPQNTRFFRRKEKNADDQ